jgi:hypothetical protein
VLSTHPNQNMGAADSIEMFVIIHRHVLFDILMLKSGTCLKSDAFSFSAVSENSLCSTLKWLLTQVKLDSSSEMGEN